MGIRGKMLTGFLILAAMLVLAGVWSIHELRLVGTTAQRMLDENYRSIDAAHQMTAAIERQDSAVLLLVSGHWDEGRAIIATADSAFSQAFAIAQSNVTITDEQQRIDSIEDAYRRYKDLWSRPIVDTARENNLEWYFAEAHRGFLEVLEAVTDLMTLNDQTMYRRETTLEQRAQQAVMPGIVAIVSALVFSLLFNYFIDSFLVRPLIAITDGLRAFVEQQRPFEVQVRTRDELSDLVAAVRAVTTRQNTRDGH